MPVVNWVGNASYTPPPAAYGRQSQLEFMSGNGPLQLGRQQPSFPRPRRPRWARHNANHPRDFLPGPAWRPAPRAASANYGNLNTLAERLRLLRHLRAGHISPRAFLPRSPTRRRSEYRYRLMEYLQPSDYLNIYTSGAGKQLRRACTVPTWISNGIPDLTGETQSDARSPCAPIASNIVALIILPEVFSKPVRLSARSKIRTTSTPRSPCPRAARRSYNYDSAYNANARIRSGRRPTSCLRWSR